jgi:glycosyltransferase involved in cell wall biosynthesis
MQNIGRTKLPQDTGDFRILSRNAVDAIKNYREQHRFMKGLFTLIGFSQTSIEYNRDPRFAGRTKWNYWKLWNFALEGITSFTISPLKISSYVGTFIAFLAFIYASLIIAKTLLYGEPVRGYPSLVSIVLFLGGIQLIVLGIIGEYLGRIFTETKNRPLYFIKKIF